LHIGSKSLVEELENLGRLIYFVWSHEPLILLLVELLSVISLSLLERHSQMGDSLKAMLKEELMIIF
jgi:hypothetical protein